MGTRRGKRVLARVKMELEAGRATPAPPVGTRLGPYGLSLGEFVRQYNDATREKTGTIVPAEVTVYEDRTFSFVTKTPPTASLLREAAGVGKGSGTPGREPMAGSVTGDQLRRIAETKMPDLNAGSLEAAMRVVEGTARSMGIRVSA
ncbi:MAG: 50S ribosomal protein L11 [Rubrobacter sp.]|nr:50S ribosomal protein L11 [Rubrobacter sp.]